MSKPLRNILLWTVIAFAAVALLHVSGFNISHISSTLPGWSPFAAYLVVWLILAARMQKTHSAKAMTMVNAIAATAHADAEQVIALLGEIRNLQRARLTASALDENKAPVGAELATP